MNANTNAAIERLNSLTSDELVCVEIFIEFIIYRDQFGKRASLNDPSFEAIWNNPEDRVYDTL